MSAVTDTAARAAYEVLIDRVVDAEPHSGFLSDKDLPALAWADCATVLRAEPEILDEIMLPAEHLAAQFDRIGSPELQRATNDIACTLMEAVLVQVCAQVLRDAQRESERREEECTCRPRVAGPVDIDPPERQRDPWCPLHGKDPDSEREKALEDAT